MKVAMWALELGLVDKFVEVAPVARPGHLRLCGYFIEMLMFLTILIIKCRSFITR
jgi:hypothetical protein